MLRSGKTIAKTNQYCLPACLVKEKDHAGDNLAENLRAAES
jgi:hypothetical protein